MIKAVKEAKVHTSWLTPNEPYEEALRTFVRRVLTGAGGAKLLPAVLPLQRKVAHLAIINSLAQVTLKIASPGVPDFYQGTDLWDLSLVDPDNRRPVDYDLRRRLLDKVSDATAADVLAWADDGAPKLWLTQRTLRARPRFANAGYQPRYAEGQKADHAVA